MGGAHEPRNMASPYYFLLHMAGILNAEALSHHMDKPRPLVLLRFQLHCCCNRPHKVTDVLAAQLLHPKFLTSIDPGIPNTMQKFEQECEVLSTTKHPCIVKYPGTAKDPATGQLVLLNYGAPGLISMIQLNLRPSSRVGSGIQTSVTSPTLSNFDKCLASPDYFTHHPQ